MRREQSGEVFVRCRGSDAEEKGFGDSVQHVDELDGMGLVQRMKGGIDGAWNDCDLFGIGIQTLDEHVLCVIGGDDYAGGARTRSSEHGKCVQTRAQSTSVLRIDEMGEVVNGDDRRSDAQDGQIVVRGAKDCGVAGDPGQDQLLGERVDVALEGKDAIAERSQPLDGFWLCDATEGESGKVIAEMAKEGECIAAYAGAQPTCIENYLGLASHTHAGSLAADEEA